VAKEEDTDSTLGWDAITAALTRIYGDQEPLHFGTIIKFSLGGNDPLDGLSIYRSIDGSHWHYVSYGMSELYSKEGENKEYSGWGFEFTMRLSRSEEENQPPRWPMSLMQNLARYVFKTGNIFADGHHLDCNGPIALEYNTELKALLFAQDPQLKEIDTPHGRLQFIQLVGITQDERKAVINWNPNGIKKLLAKDNPLLVTDLDRTSILKDTATFKKFEVESARDGSTTDVLYVSNLNLKRPMSVGGKIEWIMGARVVEDLISLLKGRILHGRPLLLMSDSSNVELVHGDALAVKSSKEKTQLTLPTDLCTEICSTLKTQRGVYNFKTAPRLSIILKPSEIKSPDGKTVVNVIG
jgi:suppressor of fused